MVKGVLITNSLLWLVYFARFKNYRNSYLALMHIPVSLMGLQFALGGTRPVFETYLF